MPVAPQTSPFSRLPAGVLGRAQITGPLAGFSGASVQDLAGLAVTVNVKPGRLVRVSGQCFVTRTVADGFTQVLINEGANVLQNVAYSNLLYSYVQQGAVLLQPSGGSHTYKLTIQFQTGTGTTGIDAGPQYPAFILVEDLGAYP